MFGTCAECSGYRPVCSGDTTDFPVCHVCTVDGGGVCECPDDPERETGTAWVAWYRDTRWDSETRTTVPGDMDYYVFGTRDDAENVIREWCAVPGVYGLGARVGLSVSSLAYLTGAHPLYRDGDSGVSFWSLREGVEMHTLSSRVYEFRNGWGWHPGE